MMKMGDSFDHWRIEKRRPWLQRHLRASIYWSPGCEGNHNHVAEPGLGSPHFSFTEKSRVRIGIVCTKKENAYHCTEAGLPIVLFPSGQPTRQKKVKYVRGMISWI